MSRESAKAKYTRLSGDPEVGYISPDDVMDAIDIMYDDLVSSPVVDADVAADADIDRSKIAGTALTSASMGVFNVLDYGAVGDGVTDDTVAIQDCIDAAAGGTVLLPAGVYATTGGLTVDTAEATILAAGASLLVTDDDDAGVVLDITAESVTVDGLTIDADGHNLLWGIVVDDDAAHVTLRNIDIGGISGTATNALIRVRQGCSGLLVTGCHIHDITSTNVGRGILLNDDEGVLTGVRIVDNLFERIGPTADGDAIVVQTWPTDVEMVIANNVFRECRKRAIKIMNGGVVVTGNIMDFAYDAEAGVAYSSISVYASNVIVTDNQMSGVVSNSWIEVGVTGTAVSDVVVSGNVCRTDLANAQASQDGLSLTSSTSEPTYRVTVANNILLGGRYGVRVQNAYSALVISRNLISDFESVVILDDNGGTAIDNVQVSDNVANAIEKYYLTTSGGGNPTNLAVTNNIGTAPFGYAQGTVLANAKHGFFGKVPAAKPTVSGSCGSNAALIDLINELATLGLITDSTTDS